MFLTLTSLSTQLSHQQHARCGALPPQLYISFLREPLLPHCAGRSQRGALWCAGHEPEGGPYVQAAGVPNAAGLGAGLRRRLQGLLAHPAQDQDRPVRVPRSSQRGADRVETLGTGRGKAEQGGATEGAGETHPGHEAEGTVLGCSFVALLIAVEVLVTYLTVKCAVDPFIVEHNDEKNNLSPANELTFLSAY